MAVVVLRVPSDEAGLAEDGPRTRRWQLVGESTSIGRARRLTLQTCQLWGLDLAAEAELVVSELVANAVMHGWGRIGLRLAQVDDGGLLVEVEDENPHAPAAAPAGRGGPGGYGLHVVERLAEWGWRPSGNGKTVWARVRGRTITG
jgi:anti-sigma regulatory factor (Ser/Thr protein kinase)